MQLSREEFKDIVSRLQEISSRVSEIYRVTEGSLSLINYDDAFQSVIAILLAKVMTADQFEIFSWWMYEGTERKLYSVEGDTKVAIDLDTPDALYDYLVSGS